MYFVLAMCLFPQPGYLGVWGKLTAALDGLRLAVPSPKAPRDVRRRIGIAPVRRLFEVLAGPLVQPRTPGIMFGGYPTVSFDGCKSIKVPDTVKNRTWLGKHKASNGQAGYPALSLMTLGETGTVSHRHRENPRHHRQGDRDLRCWPCTRHCAPRSPTPSRPCPALAIKASKGAAPASSTADWALLAAKGDTGNKGLQGERGLQGPRGPAGTELLPGQLSLGVGSSRSCPGPRTASASRSGSRSTAPTCESPTTAATP